MPSSRGFHRPIRSSQRRRKGWDFGPGGTGATVVNSSSAAFTGSSLSALVDGLTLARLRGRLQAYLSAGDAANSGFSGAFGIGVTTQSAVAAGITAVPTPVTEQDWDGWIYWTPIQVFAHAAADLEFAKVDMEIDTRAMRKLNENSSIYAVVELVEVVNAIVQIHFDSRVLVLLA